MMTYVFAISIGRKLSRPAAIYSMMHVMSEVKFDVRRYKVPAMIGVSGDIIKHSPPVAMVHASSFDAVAGELDAQRLRADTAEAEMAKLRERHDTVKCQRNDAAKGLVATEQRIAELESILRSAVEWFDDGVGRSIAEFCKLQEMRAALNPNPEAESHEKH